jgi:type IV secretion system protein VirB10
VYKGTIAAAPAAIVPLYTPVSAVPQPAMRPAYAPMPLSAPLRGTLPNRLAAPALVYDSGTLALPESAAQRSSGPAPVGTAAPGSAGDDFAARLGAGSSGAATASAALNPATTVAQGTLIPAVLETAIDTDVPGYVRAIVSSDVRSFDGSHVLVPRSARLVGQYKSGLQAGQRRVYVIWTRLIRPDGVAVNIGSPATGFDGESGLSGNVNSHFFQRFGSAMLLTVVGGLSAIGTSGTGVIIAGSGQSAAAAAVGQTGQIGPTVRVHPGEPIRVFTARDLDFARVSAP